MFETHDYDYASGLYTYSGHRYATADLEEVNQILETARGLIEKPSHWIKGYRHGRKTISKGFFTKRYETIDTYCMIGAIEEAAGSVCTAEYIKAVEIVETAIAKRLGLSLNSLTITKFNDTYAKQHRTVLSVFDAAIKESQVAAAAAKKAEFDRIEHEKEVERARQAAEVAAEFVRKGYISPEAQAEKDKIIADLRAEVEAQRKQLDISNAREVINSLEVNDAEVSPVVPA